MQIYAERENIFKNTNTMSTQILPTEAMTALTSKFPGMDTAQLQSIAAEVFKAAPAPQRQRTRKEIPAGERCMARMWTQEQYDAEGNYIYGCPKQCCRRKNGGNDFCAQHQRAFEENPKPLQFTNNGTGGKFKRHGLFHGRVDEPLPFKDDQGHIVIFWNGVPEVKEWVEAAKANGSYKEHPAWRDLWLGERMNGGRKKGKKKSEVAKKTKTSKAKVLGFKPKRGINAYMAFLNENRASIRSELEAASDGAKVGVAEVTKKAGAMWKELQTRLANAGDGKGLEGDEAATYAADTEAMARYNKASLESKEAAKAWNEEQEKNALGSLDDQIAQLQALKAAADKTSTVASDAPAPPPAASAPAPAPTAPTFKLKKTVLADQTDDVFGPDSDDEDDDASATESKSIENDAVTAKPTVAVKISKSASPEPLEEVECEHTGMMTFQHNGMKVYKQTKEDVDDESMGLNDGDFRLLIVDDEEGGIEEGAFTHYGKMTASGEITVELATE